MTVIVSPPVPKSDQRFDDWMYLFWKRVFEAIAGAGGGPVDLTDYAYLPGRVGGQLLHGGANNDDALILQGTAGTSGDTADAILLKTGTAGDQTAVKVRGDGSVAINGDYDGTYGMPTAISGGALFQGGNGEIGMLSVTTDTVAAGFFNLGEYVVNIGQNATQTSNIGAGALLSIYKNQDMNGYDNLAGMIDLHDSPSGTGNRTNVTVSIKIDSIIRARLYPRIPDGTIGEAYLFDTKTEITQTDTKLLSIKNSGVTKFSIDCNGMLFCDSIPEYTDNADAVSDGLVVGNVYHTGGDLKIVI